MLLFHVKHFQSFSLKFEHLSGKRKKALGVKPRAFMFHVKLFKYLQYSLQIAFVREFNGDFALLGTHC